MKRPSPAAEFDAHAARYEQELAQGLDATGEGKEYFADGRMRWLATRLRRRGVRVRGTVLDFGCGLGSSTPLFFDHLAARHVVGVDVSEGLLERARATYAGDPRVRFATIEAHDAPASADLAFVNGVFHHIPVVERGGALAYVRRTLRPGGWFAFWENNPWNPGTRYVMSQIPFDRHAITIAPPDARRMLRDAGFEVVETTYRFWFPRALRALRPFESALTRVPFGGQYLVLSRTPRT